MALQGFSVALGSFDDSPHNYLPNTNIEIRKDEAGEPLATIYADRDGLIPIAQPGAKTNSEGVFIFYAEAGQYLARHTVDAQVFSTPIGSAEVNHGQTIDKDKPGSAHDQIYRRKTTVAEIAAGKFVLGDLLEVSDRAGARFDVVAGGTPNGYDILDAGGGNTAELQSINGRVLLSWAGALAGLGDVIPHHDALLAYAIANGYEYVIDAVYNTQSTAHFPSGYYTVDSSNGHFVASSGVVKGITIGDVGGNTFTGLIKRPKVVKSAVNGGLTDYGIVYVNCTEAVIDKPESRNFDYGHALMPESASRVAYCEINSPISFGHIFGIYTFPVDTSYVTENTFTAGRLHATVAARLNSHIALDDGTAGLQAVEHNRFIGVSIEGYSGGGTSGNRAAWIRNASHNIFLYCRSEEYNAGWAVEAYHIENGSSYNTIIDSRYDARILDASTGDGNNFDSPIEGLQRIMKSGGQDRPLYGGKRTATVVSKHLIDAEDTYASSGNVRLLHLKSSASIAAPRTHKAILIETAFGEIFVVDDAGSLMPRDNFATLGKASNRFNGIFSLLPTYADDAAAGAGGLGAGAFYKTAAGDVKVKL